MVEFYQREGFRKDSVTTRRQLLCLEETSIHPDSLLLHGNHIEIVPLESISIDAVQAYDERHEISPRPHFLEQWLNHRAGAVFVAVDSSEQCHGYVRIRPCLLPLGQGWRIGPLLAEEPGIASLLLSNAMDRHKGIILIDTPGHNRSASAVAGAQGFRRMGTTYRMYKGSLNNSHDQNIYGLACLELG
jgi:ribosomal-protein-alanine N-acetyltransferase